MENIEAQTTLRDDLLASFDQVESGDVATDAPPIETAAPEETEEQKAQRARDEAGRFAKEPEKKAEVKPEVKPAAQEAAPAPAPKKPRPSSWKKDFDPHWDTFAPEVQDYIHQRESEFAKGVSTYKQEAEHARALNEVIAPFMPVIQQHGVQPTQLIGNLLSAHQNLALGSPQDKVMMGAKLIKDYGIDPQQLFQVLSGQAQYQQPQMQRPQPQLEPQNIERIVEEKLLAKEIDSEYKRFMTEVPEKYPHYEAVKETMAGLLQAELAQDYKSAYEAALRHPRHSAIFEQEQQQRLQQEQAATDAKKQGVVNRARSQAVSVKSSTPSGTMTTVKATNSLRDDIASAFESVASSRV